MQEQPGRITDADDPGFAQLEAADLVGCAEPILDAADHPQSRVLVALEVEDHVDEVLERARTCHRALLRDVPDEQHRNPGRLGQRGQRARDGANLGDTADDAVDVRGEHRLHGIDDQQARLDLLDVAEDGGEVGLGGEEDALVYRAGPIGTQPHLTRRLLARDVERSAIGRRSGPPMHHLEQQRRLADSGLAGEEHDRTGDEAATQNTIELVESGGVGLRGGTADGRQSCSGRGGNHGPTARTKGRCACACGERSSGGLDFVHRAPVTALGAATDPFGDRVTARGAAVARLQFDHAASLTMGTDRVGAAATRLRCAPSPRTRRARARGRHRRER